jgi:hypothetical protein
MNEMTDSGVAGFYQKTETFGKYGLHTSQCILSLFLMEGLNG